jgi:hypothetical protein
MKLYLVSLPSWRKPVFAFTPRNDLGSTLGSRQQIGAGITLTQDLGLELNRMHRNASQFSPEREVFLGLAPVSGTILVIAQGRIWRHTTVEKMSTPTHFGEGVALTTITLYKPGESAIRYNDPTEITLENGVLSFYWTKEISRNKQKVVTTVPFLIQQDIAMDQPVAARTQREVWNIGQLAARR